MAKRAEMIEEPVGPRGDLGAYVIATLAVLMAIVAWVIAAHASHTANHALTTANQAAGTAKDARDTAIKNNPAAGTQAAPSTGAGPNTSVPAAGSGNTMPNGNGQ